MLSNLSHCGVMKYRMPCIAPSSMSVCSSSMMMITYGKMARK